MASISDVARKARDQGIEFFLASFVEMTGASKAKRKAGEHNRPHQADPLDGRQGRVEFLLDSRKRYTDAADALHVEKRSEANNYENA